MNYYLLNSKTNKPMTDDEIYERLARLQIAGFQKKLFPEYPKDEDIYLEEKNTK